MIPSVTPLQQLTDLPATFQRPGAPYTQLIEALNAGLTAFTTAIDATVGETFVNATGGWLDVWGAIFSIQRMAGEGDGAFRARISATLLAWVGTVPALEQWGLETLGQTVTVTEFVIGNLGYALTFPPALSQAVINNFVASLNRIRPAGVPFILQQAQTGLYLDTINYTDNWAVIGGYLSDGIIAVTANLSALTNSTQPLLPEYYFSDPVLNAS